MFRRLKNLVLHPTSIQSSLLRTMAFLILLSSGTTIAVTHHFAARQAHKMVDRTFSERVRERTRLTLQELFGNTRRNLLMARGWGQEGLFDLSAARQINAMLIPILQQNEQISSVLIADHQGNELLLLRDGDNWRNRISDALNVGKRSRWLNWSHSMVLLDDDWKDMDYDPRQRPWFQGAMRLKNEGDIFWTRPYTFFTTKDPGITVSTRWKSKSAADSVFVIAFDILLIDIARFTTRFHVSERGKLVVLTEDNRVLGLPQDSRYEEIQAMRKAIFSPVVALNIPPLTEAVRVWEEKNHRNPGSFWFASQGENWWGDFYLFSLGERKFWIGTVAPRSDLMGELRKTLLIFLAIILTVSGIAFILARKFAAAYSRPLERLATQSQRIGRLDLDDRYHCDSRLKEVSQLADAQERMRAELEHATKELQASQRELEAYSKDLEEKVAERTFELTEANQSLKNEITERKQMEEELKLAHAAAEEANRAKSAFLANMSHEIRTPMNGIIGFTNLALGTALNAQQQDYLNKISTSAQALLHLINDILDFSKIEAGKLDIDQTDFQLQFVLEELADLFAQQAAEKDIEMIFARDPDVPSALIGDALRLRQILVNLVNNAVKFTDQGEILIQVGCVKQDADQARLRFRVRDTGIGIAPEKVSELFHAFTQADTSTTRKYGGTGLGLTICRQLVNLMGGDIRAESELGRGTTFTFELPFQKQPEKGEPEHLFRRDLLSCLDLRNLKVLVVDDNQTSRQVVTEMVRSFGFEVQAVDSGEKALKALADAAETPRPFEMVIMDWKMPGLDGLSASRQIRENPGFADLPIVMVTAFGREQEKEIGQAIGINGFLTKPVQQSVLFNTLMEVLSCERGFSMPERQAPTLKSAQERLLRGARVLLVEDNMINQELAENLLSQAGMAVDLANNGLEAVEAVRKRDYDVVLMDMQMPRMDGYEASRVIRQDERLQSLPIIAMTAHAMRGDREKCLEAGMNDYVSKPIDPDKLFATIRKWTRPETDRREPRQEAIEISNKTTSALPAEPSGVEAGSGQEDLPASLPGFDLAAGLKRMRGNRRLYRKLLQDFATNFSEVTVEIREALAGEEMDRAHNLVHNLKGTAGNLAAGDLLSAAAEMEKLVRKGKEDTSLAPEAIDNAFDTLENALNRALASIRTLGPAVRDKTAEPSAESMEAMPPELAGDTAQRLRDAVEMGDVTELAVIAGELQSRSVSFKPFSEKIARMAEDFDFDGILELASQLEMLTE